MFSVKCKLCTFYKHYFNVHRLRTRVHVHNFSLHEIVAYMICTETYSYVHGQTCMQISKFLSPECMAMIKPLWDEIHFHGWGCITSITS